MKATDDGLQQQEDDADIDVLGRVTTRTEKLAATASYAAHDIVTQYGYGPFDVLRDVIDTKQNLSHVDYDMLGRRKTLVDPDVGTHSETHDAFGQVTDETDAGRTVSFRYDALGRPIREQTTEGVNTFTWDTAVNGIGSLASSASQDGVGIAYRYNSRRRLAGETWSVPSLPGFDLDYGYNDFGDPASIQYPAISGNRYGVSLNYATNGDLSGATLGNAGEFWQVDSRDAERNILGETTGDGFVTSRGYEPERGMLTSRWLTSTRGGTQTRVDTLTQTYDTRGYLEYRSHVRPANGAALEEESFKHDELGRLTRWWNTAWTGHYDYDDIGNMLVREVTSGSSHDLKSYTPGGTAGPHAVTTAVVNGVTENYQYDPSGRQILGPNRSVGWTDFDLPRSVTRSGATTTFSYDADHHRAVKQGALATTIYIGSLYERRVAGGVVTHVMYVPGESGAIAQVTQVEGGGAPSITYFHKDQLGSIDEMTSNPTGSVAAVTFEPFGDRLNPASVAAFPMTTLSPESSVTRGFTGHEHDDDLGLINMAGRVYDPRLARFLTPDPVVTDGFESQALNPYSYVRNSPLRFIDPTGFEGYQVSPVATAPPGSTARGGVPGGGPSPHATSGSHHHHGHQSGNHAGPPAAATHGDDSTGAGTSSSHGTHDWGPGSHGGPGQGPGALGPGDGYGAAQGQGGGHGPQGGPAPGGGGGMINTGTRSSMDLTGFNGGAQPKGSIAGPIEGLEKLIFPGSPEELLVYGMAGPFGELMGAAARKAAGMVAGKALGRAAARAATRGGRVVIGKVGDLAKGLGQGERSLLSELPNIGTPKANWAQNAGKLREIMRQGAPIRDATVNESGALINNTGFLRAERNLLESQGWTYNPGTTSWLPPAP